MREKVKITVPEARRTVRAVGKRGARWLESSHISIRLVKEGPVTEAGFSWKAPAEHRTQWIEVELDHPVNPWEHEGAGSISWGASLDRLAPLGEEAVSIIKEAWEQPEEDPHDRAEREEKESEPVDREPTDGVSIKPGWASRVEPNRYWVHLTLYQPVNERWRSEKTRHTMRGELINDGIVKRGVTVEATTRLGRRAMRIVESLHSAHPYDALDPPQSGDCYG